METVSLSFEELMEMLQRNQHLVPTVKAKCVLCCQSPHSSSVAMLL